MNIKYTYLFFISYFLFLGNPVGTEIYSEKTIELITTKTVFTAGEKIVLEFATNKITTTQLYCSNSYGSTLLIAETKENKLSFTIPSHYGSKRGVVNWKLITGENLITGNFTIIPKETPVSLETYIGPPSIIAGGTDYTMYVVIPTDDLDNPLKQNTKVNFQQQFLSKEKKESILTNNLIAYKNIYSPLKSGRILLSSAAFELNSKEYSINIMPAIGTDFIISSDRNHKYADGNQITTFSTSIIKDTNNNIVSDGSYVEFFIKNKKGNVLKTSGKTINGVAFAKIIHPEFEDEWTVKAYITGVSESNEIKLIFKQVIENFKVQFSKNSRDINVGPLQSFMNQMMPDGLKVTLLILKNGKLVDSIIKKSIDGFVNFELDANIYPDETYDIKISTAGINKVFNSKKLW
jgi:hypothetical protein